MVRRGADGVLAPLRRIGYCAYVVLLCCCLVPGLAHAQNVPVNGNMVVWGHYNYCAPASSTAGPPTVYACNLALPPPAGAAYGIGSRYAATLDIANTGAATINFSSLGAKSIVKAVGSITTALVSGDLCAGMYAEFEYNGTNMQLLTPVCNVPPAAAGGSSGQAQYNQSSVISGSAGLTLNGTDITAEKRRRTTVSTNVTLGASDGPYIECSPSTTDKTLTLPTAATAPWGTLWIEKKDNAAGKCILAPATGERINETVNGTVSADTQNSTIELRLTNTTTPNWHATTSIPAPLPVAYGGTGSATPTRSIFIPAGSMDVEGTCAANAAAALVTNGPKLPTISCTDSDTDGIDFDFIMPDGWNAGTITVELAIFYTGTTHNTQVFDMNFSGQCVRHGDTVAAFAITSGATAESSSNVEVQLTASGTANRELKAASAAITLAGTCAAGAHVYMHGLVDAGSTTFTPMSELKIVGAKVEYQRNAND